MKKKVLRELLKQREEANKVIDKTVENIEKPKKKKKKEDK